MFTSLHSYISMLTCIKQKQNACIFFRAHFITAHITVGVTFYLKPKWSERSNPLSGDWERRLKSSILWFHGYSSLGWSAEILAAEWQKLKKLKKKNFKCWHLFFACKLKFFFYLHHHSPLNSLNITQQFLMHMRPPAPNPGAKFSCAEKQNSETTNDYKGRQRERQTERRRKEKRAIEEAVGVTKDVSRENRTLVSRDHTL